MIKARRSQAAAESKTCTPEAFVGSMQWHQEENGQPLPVSKFYSVLGTLLSRHDLTDPNLLGELRRPSTCSVKR